MVDQISNGQMRDVTFTHYNIYYDIGLENYAQKKTNFASQILKVKLTFRTTIIQQQAANLK